MASKISNKFPIIHNWLSYTNSRFFIDTGETVQKGHGDQLKLSENLEFPAWVLSYDFLSYTCFSVTHAWNHAWKTGWKVYVSAYEAHQVLRMCLKY